MQFSLTPDQTKNCIGITLERGVMWSPTLGIPLSSTRGGLIQDPAVDPYASPSNYYNIPARNRSWYARTINRFDISNYVISTKRLGIDFYVPPGFIDFSRYQISSVTIKLYCYNRIPNGHATITKPNFDLAVYNRASGTKLISEALSQNSSLYANLATGTLLDTQTISSEGQWYEWTTTNATLINSLQNRSFISIGFKQVDETDYPTGTEDSTYPGHPGPAVQRAYDYDTFTHAAFYLFDGPEEYLPQLEVEYEIIDEPGVISSFSVDTGRSKHSAEASGLVIVSDTEEENQLLEIEAQYKIPGATNYGNFVLIDAQSLTSPSPSGTEYEWTADISTPIAETNLVFTNENWLYDFENTASGASYIGPHWSVAPGGTVAAEYPIGRLSPSGQYLVSASGSGAFTLSVYVDNIFLDSEISTTPSLSFVPSGHAVSIVAENTSLSSISLYKPVLLDTSKSINDVYYTGRFRARCVEPGQTGDYFTAIEEILVDNRIPAAITISEPSSDDEVFQNTTPSGVFSWTPSSHSTGISGYYVSLTSTKNPLLNNTNADLLLGTQLSYSGVVPTEGKWYFSIAPVASSQVVGNTQSYGFWYNDPEDFVDASGVYINGVRLQKDLVTWVSSSGMQFSWVAPAAKPGNTYTYYLQVSASGTVENTRFEWDYEWNEDLLFKTVVKNSAGVIFAESSTEEDYSGWEYYDGENWNDVYDVFIPSGTKIAYVPTASKTIPDATSLHTYLQIGVFNQEDGGIVNYSAELNPITNYFGVSGIGYASEIAEETIEHSGNIKMKMLLTPSAGGSTKTFTSATIPVGFLYKNQDELWEQFPISGIHTNDELSVKVNIEPYMQLDENLQYDVEIIVIKDGIEDDSIFSPIFNLDLQNPDSDKEWELINPLIDVSGIQQNSYQTNISINTSTPYFCRVKVFDGLQYGEWSSVYKFKTNTRPSAPKNLRIV